MFGLKIVSSAATRAEQRVDVAVVVEEPDVAALDAIDVDAEAAQGDQRRVRRIVRYFESNRNGDAFRMLRLRRSCERAARRPKARVRHHLRVDRGG